jgi:hypothetical protein
LSCKEKDKIRIKNKKKIQFLYTEQIVETLGNPTQQIKSSRKA